MTIINESGLYSLIFSSKLESAKRFKRWVTSEVLPAIRKTGSYQVPSDPMQALKLMFEATEQTKEEIATVKADVIDIKENQKLDAGEYGLITKQFINALLISDKFTDYLIIKKLTNLYIEILTVT